MKTKQIKNKKLKSLLPEIEKRIRTAFGSKVLKIILYGSYARGDYDRESDVDILVIVDDRQVDSYRKLRGKIVDSIIDEFGLLLSITIEKASIYDRYNTVSPFFINVSREGVLLYG